MFDPLELVHRETRQPRFTRESTRENEVVTFERSIFAVLASHFDGPRFRLFVVLRFTFDRRFEPDIEFHDFGVMLHPIGDLVLGSICLNLEERRISIDRRAE